MRHPDTVHGARMALTVRISQIRLIRDECHISAIRLPQPPQEHLDPASVALDSARLPRQQRRPRQHPVDQRDEPDRRRPRADRRVQHAARLTHRDQPLGPRAEFLHRGHVPLQRRAHLVAVFGAVDGDGEDAPRARVVQHPRDRHPREIAQRPDRVRRRR